VFVTNLGYLYSLSVDQFPSSSGYGSPIQKFLKFRDGERIVESFALHTKKPSQEALSIAVDTSEIEEGSTLALVSAHGLGFALTVEELSGIKKNGKRVMKLRDGDELRGVLPISSEMALFTEGGYGLVVKSKDFPVRTQPALGVILISVKEGDQLVGAIPKAKKVRITPEQGKEREVTFASLPKGRRGTRGKKVVARGGIVSVEEMQ
jgi:DNA gyrase subunit A